MKISRIKIMFSSIYGQTRGISLTSLLQLSQLLAEQGKQSWIWNTFVFYLLRTTSLYYNAIIRANNESLTEFRLLILVPWSVNKRWMAKKRERERGKWTANIDSILTPNWPKERKGKLFNSNSNCTLFSKYYFIQF